MRKPISIAVCAGLLALSIGTSQAGLLMKPTYNPDLDYQADILKGTYDAALTHPDSILGFPVGQRVATPYQINKSIQTWRTQTDRMKVVEYARSHEDRPLHAVFISSPSNLANMDDILEKLDALSDPRRTSESEAKELINELPAIAWMAYSIHGNETSGADAALASIYHYAASEDPKIRKMLDDMIIVIDPIMNPDGRDRFAKSLEQYRGTAPNVDDQALLHRGDWPYGRTNHYFFDLNRDFFYLTQPETKGRVALINKWRPQLMIDGHEMGPQDTYLMGPPRQPLNFNIAPSVQKWAKTFSIDQGQAFDKEGWRYYTGEWFENWYPGYSNYAEYRGSMHILYEQSRMAEDGVRRPEGTIQTYKESVHHQFVSTIANLESLHKYSKEMYQDYWKDRKSLVEKDSPYANRTFIVSANNNHTRMNTLVEKLLAQDIEVFVANKDFSVKKATNHLGQTFNTTVSKGSLVIPNRQPEARLLAAIMEFDAQILPETVEDERQKILREGRSIMYDTSAWNLTMMYGLEALTVPDHITNNIEPWKAQDKNQTLSAKDAIAWAVNGDDDASVGFAARLMERGVQVRVIDKATQLGKETLVRGSVVVTITDNPNTSDLIELINTTAKETKLSIQNITTGYGTGDLPEWGGDHFQLLTKPQIGVIGQAGTSSNDVGATWWSIDTHLGIRHSHLDTAAISRTDLRRYNVLVMPSAWSVSDSTAKALKTWVQQGGTLITHEGATQALASKDGTTVKLVSDIFKDAEKFDIALQRRLLAEESVDDMEDLFATTVSEDVSYPWDDAPKRLSEDELKKRDKWQQLFMPAGAMVSGSVDQEHWLSFGTNEQLPLLYGRQPVLVVPENAEAVVTVGVYKDKKSTKKSKDKDDDKAKAIAWYSLPQDKELHVRMSGLLWPEAAQRIANSAYLTRERVGSGQIIMFSGEPIFRGATLGTNRLLLNAIVYGPGMGTRANIEL
ncbi:M14 family metallopeptidase [Alteromonas sp. W364]|uniref:M14 family metallopeptidase n=1 Tax=Alteromonas sp. W364 TaxID=3075610 RepID=UPI002883F850|nr:M14 family metallopeptidase [Alteromonas sp. W364]MDT0627205.1 M14 family metallopeptidase [Alteromonas sp. W364]